MIDFVLRRPGDKLPRERRVTLRPGRAPDAANEYRFMEDLLCVGRGYCHWTMHVRQNGRKFGRRTVH
jgi:hypothetical protein